MQQQRSQHRSQPFARAFTLAELAVVLAMIAIAMAIGLMSIVDSVRTQQRNAALSLANLTLREQRSQALESRKPHFVRPAAGGKGVVLGTATSVDAAGKCSGLIPKQTIELAGLRVSGSSICFTEDGNTDDSNSQDLNFAVPGATGNVAAVSVFPAGTFRWSGMSLFRMSGLAMTSISFRSVANANISLTQLQ